MKRSLIRFAAIAALGYSIAAFSQTNDRERDLFAEIGIQRPNSELPPSIPAPLGELSLYADFDTAQAGKVALFLINRTNQAVQLPSQDGDLYLKLEFETEDHRWQRAQSHQYSFCVNSYIAQSLAPGCHLIHVGYLPSEGIEAKVRFASYGGLPLSSNIGKGHYRPEDVREAELDDMAATGLPPLPCRVAPLRAGVLPAWRLPKRGLHRSGAAARRPTLAQSVSGEPLRQGKGEVILGNFKRL